MVVGLKMSFQAVLSPRTPQQKPSPTLPSCPILRAELFSALKCFQFCHKLTVAFNRADVLSLPCGESLVFILTGDNEWPPVFPRPVPMKQSLSLTCISCLLMLRMFTVRKNKISMDSPLQLSPIRIKTEKGFNFVQLVWLLELVISINASFFVQVCFLFMHMCASYAIKNSGLILIARVMFS